MRDARFHISATNKAKHDRKDAINTVSATLTLDLIYLTVSQVNCFSVELTCGQRPDMLTVEGIIITTLFI